LLEWNRISWLAAHIQTEGQASNPEEALISSDLRPKIGKSKPLKMKREDSLTRSATLMVFEHAEKLKVEYTDKYVIVDDQRPELLRFDGLTGTVRTVNMNGRALVEFNGFDNIGWFDIDIDYLKVIDEPLPIPEQEAPKKAAAAPKKAAPKAAAPAAEAKAAPTSGGGMSVADMLAAARGDGPTPAAKAEAPAAEPAAPTAAAPQDPQNMSVADMLAAARGESSAPAAKAEVPAAEPAAPTAAPPQDPQNMSVADMLAAARGESSAPAAKSEAPAAEAEAPAAPESTTANMSVSEMLEAAKGDTSPGARQPAPASSPAPPRQTSNDTGEASRYHMEGMSFKDLISAARDQDSSSSGPFQGQAAPPTAAEPEPAAAETEAAAPEAVTEEAVEAAASVVAESGELPTDTAGIVAFLRG
jgi:hypothetical protein